MTTEQILERLKGVKRSGEGWTARCPAHDDHNPSLSVGIGDDGKTLLKCHSGCDWKAVCKAIGIREQDLFPTNSKPTVTPPKIVKAYDYHDESGNLVYQVCRYEPKSFKQRKSDGNGGWIWKMDGVERVPYRLPQVIEAIANCETVVICEGEKDCDAVYERTGLTATTNAGGACSSKKDLWPTAWKKYFQGADVIICGDHDKPGETTGADHIQHVARKLSSAAHRIRIIDLPQSVNGKSIKDAADYFGAGGTPEQFRELIDGAADWQPQVDKPEDFTQTECSNQADIRGQILQILTDKNMSDVVKRNTISQTVIGQLSSRGQFYHHETFRDFATAMFFDADRKRLERIQSDSFTAWLGDWLQINRSDKLFRSIQSSVETESLAGNTKGILPEAYWAARSNAVYLSNGPGKVIKITASNIEEASNGIDGVLFPVGKTLSSWKLTDPKNPFNTCSIFRDVNCSASHGMDLLKLWMFSLPTNPRSKPPLCLAGDIGSGKTRLAKGIAELYGIPFVASKVEEQSEGDFWPNMDQGGIYTLDNADTRVKWLPDALASAATDGCQQKRRLYTNSETVILRARAWVAVTTMNPTFASDSGLADRLLVVRMNRREGETCDAQLTDEVLANRDAGLSFIAHGIRSALDDSAIVPSGLNMRHPDFASFAVKIGRATGREVESIAALKNAEADKSSFCIENDFLGSALLAFVEEVGIFKGTAADLLEKLKIRDGDLSDVSTKKLGKRLCSLWPHLEKTINAKKSQDPHDKKTVFSFRNNQSCGVCGVSNGILDKTPHEESSGGLYGKH